MRASTTITVNKSPHWINGAVEGIKVAGEKKARFCYTIVLSDRIIFRQLKKYWIQQVFQVLWLRIKYK
jgi:hypothetical protein